MKWKQRLECLKDNPNPEMKAEAIKLARHWNTCFTGERLGLENYTFIEAEDIVKRHPNGEELAIWGKAFFLSLVNDSINQTEIYMAEIEKLT